MNWLYPAALALLSVFVAVLERLRPWRPAQKVLRPALLSDFAHLVVNGHFLGVALYAVAATTVKPAFDALLNQLNLQWLPNLELSQRWPLWLQIVAALVIVDFLQWCVHNLLHRSSFLWEIHKVHHSIVDGEMDWIVSFRFHWFEVVVYKALLYLPLLPLGFGVEAVMFHAILGTLIGHLNHANLNFSWGPLRYLLNSPRMHIWHHDAAGDEKTTKNDSAGTAKNFGIIFSTWDWLFGTAYLPEHPPARLGYDGVERMPPNILAHAVWPASESPGPRRPSAAMAQLAVLGVLSLPLLVPRTLQAIQQAHSSSAPTVEAGPSSQPSRVDVASLFHAPAAGAAALKAFGEDAAERGYAHPEHMVSVLELKEALGAPSLVVLDVRPLARFGAGHIPSARQIDRDDYAQTAPIPGLARSPEELQRFLRAKGVRNDSVVVVVGDGGPEPYRLWWQLHAQGKDTRVLDGGLVGWKALGLPTEAGEEDPLPTSAAHDGDLLLHASSVPLTWDDLGDDAQGALLLDTRSTAEYAGTEQHKDAKRKGHIPGALLLPWEQMLRSAQDQRLASVAFLRQRFAEVGVVEGQRVITYCQTGTRSAVVHFALWQLGRSDDEVRNYNGSWSEYSRLDLPLSPG